MFDERLQTVLSQQPFYQGEYERLLRELEQAAQDSALPEAPPTDQSALIDILPRRECGGLLPSREGFPASLRLA